MAYWSNKTVFTQFQAALIAGVMLFATSGFAATKAQAKGSLQAFAPTSAGTGKVDHKVWDTLLQAYVRPQRSGLNLLDYRAFRARGHKQLKAYIRALSKTRVRALDRNEQFAFWINLYNAVTIDTVLDHYPVRSIKKIRLGGFFTSGPWKKQLVRVGGVRLSLDNIEHGILRGLFRDRRVHYAVNCASMGCPNLATRAYTGAKLNAMLDAGARAYINHRRGVSVKGGRVIVSSIYKWFRKDFGGSDAGVLAHLRKYANKSLKAKLKRASSVSGHDYDWSLNDVK